MSFQPYSLQNANQFLRIEGVVYALHPGLADFRAEIIGRFNALDTRLNDRFNQIAGGITDQLSRIQAEMTAIRHSDERLDQVQEGIAAVRGHLEKGLDPFLEGMTNSRNYFDERLSQDYTSMTRAQTGLNDKLVQVQGDLGNKLDQIQTEIANS